MNIKCASCIHSDFCTDRDDPTAAARCGHFKFKEDLKTGYNSPIKYIQGKLETKLEGDIMNAVFNYGIQVDKDELIKALNYDRDQYAIGYRDGTFDERRAAEEDPEQAAAILKEHCRRSGTCVGCFMADNCDGRRPEEWSLPEEQEAEHENQKKGDK